MPSLTKNNDLPDKNRTKTADKWYQLTNRHTFQGSDQVAAAAPKTPTMETNPLAYLEQARYEAIEIVSEARNQATLMLEEARKKAQAEVDEINAAASAEGYRDGYEKGYQSGQQAAAEEAVQIRAKANAVLAQTEEARQAQLFALKEEVLRLALDIAEKILTRELETNPGVIVSIAEEALQLVANRQNVVLWVHPDDLKICQGYRDHFMGLLPAQAQLQIIADEDVEQGGCVVDTDYGKVDARIQAKWDNLLQVLEVEWQQIQNAEYDN